MIADLAELQKLSGLKRRSDVRRWLTSNGIAFMVQPSGNPVTTLDAINRAMCGESKYNRPDFTVASQPSRRMMRDSAPLPSAARVIARSIKPGS